MAKILTFGELLMRLATPRGERLSEKNHFQSVFGGSEANVAISLANFGHDVSYFTTLPDNPIGYLAKEYLYSNHVNCSNVLFKPGRMGLYFVEKGQGVRGDRVIYDREHSVFSQMKQLPEPLKEVFQGVDVFFISGISFALSSELRELSKQLMQLAKQNGVKVVFDINYREKLWSTESCFTLVREVLHMVDVLSAGILDLRQLFKEVPIENLEQGYAKLVEKYPNIQAIFSTNRKTHASNHYEIQGNLYTNGQLVQTDFGEIPDVVDRIGGGDAYAAGIIHGLLSNQPPEETVKFAQAATILKHTVYGDANQFNQEDIQAFSSNTARGSIQR